MHYHLSISALLVFTLTGCLSNQSQCNATDSSATPSEAVDTTHTLDKPLKFGRIYENNTPTFEPALVNSQILIHSELTFDMSSTVADPERLVAIGDLHADMTATRSALKLAGAIDDQDHWIGDDLMVVQLGDLIDRGYQDREILDFFEDLQIDAANNGGAVHLLNGNHEVMNVQFDFGYVDANAWDAFVDIEYDPSDRFIQQYPVYMRGRVAAFRPGGPYARFLARHRIVLITKDTVFVHGALHPEHIKYGVDTMNIEVSAWMLGYAKEPLQVVGSTGPIWQRTYSYETSLADCESLERVLDGLSVKRMVVAHTVQYNGITSGCNEKVWRIDTGMSHYYGGIVSVLSISDEGVTILE